MKKNSKVTGVAREKSFVYINGLKTKYNAAILQAKELDRMMGANFWVQYNPTWFWSTGLAESFYQRWFFWVKTTSQVKKINKSFLGYFNQMMGGSLVVVGHSQGCLQAINAARLLPPELKKRTILILFACPAAFEPKGLMHVEYWRNSGDWALALLAGTRRKDEGYVFSRKGKGHYFVDDYLNKIDEFERKEDSIFYRLLKRNEKMAA